MLPLQYPQIVKELREAHERWFSDVTRRISEPCRIVLGDPAENPVHLNLQDWYMAKGNAPWYQRPFGPYVHVSSTPAPYVNGKWMVEVAQSGHYEITLRQLPREADFAIQAVEARLKIGQVDKMRAVPQWRHGREVSRWDSIRGRSPFRRGSRRPAPSRAEPSTSRSGGWETRDDVDEVFPDDSLKRGRSRTPFPVPASGLPRTQQKI